MHCEETDNVHVGPPVLAVGFIHRFGRWAAFEYHLVFLVLIDIGHKVADGASFDIDPTCA